MLTDFVNLKVLALNRLTSPHTHPWRSYKYLNPRSTDTHNQYPAHKPRCRYISDKLHIPYNPSPHTPYSPFEGLQGTNTPNTRGSR